MSGEIVELSPGLRETLSPAEVGRAAELRGLDLDSPTRNLVLRNDSRALGWCSLWLDDGPSYRDYRTGAVGQFYSDSRPTALALLGRAAEICRDQGREYLLGPLDGDTWHSYRLTTNDYERPPFFLDRLTPRSWCDWFIEAGFAPVAEYFSTQGPVWALFRRNGGDVQAVRPRADFSDPSSFSSADDATARQWDERLAEGRLVLRPLNLERFEDDLGLIHELSLAGFARNFLYTPLSLARFMELYRPLRDLVVPDLVQLAFVDQRPAGFCLCLPDYAQKQAGLKIDTVILKTFARRPEKEYRGLGAWLMRQAHQVAADKGFQQLIVAFMHRDNHSLTLALAAGGEIIRSYALYGREL